MAEHDQPRRGIADFGEALERRGDLLGGQRGFDDDEVGRRVRLVAFDRALEAAIVRGERNLGHAPVMHRRLDQLGRLRMLAERLDGDARQEPRAGRHFAGRLFGDLGVLGCQETHRLTLHRNSYRPVINRGKIRPIRCSRRACRRYRRRTSSAYGRGKSPRRRLPSRNHRSASRDDRSGPGSG